MSPAADGLKVKGQLLGGAGLLVWAGMSHIESFMSLKEPKEPQTWFCGRVGTCWYSYPPIL